jgi:hypothetical protein
MSRQAHGAVPLPPRRRYYHRCSCGRLIPEGVMRCSARTCPEFAPTWARDTRRRLLENLRTVRLSVMFSVTAPGADLYPFDARFCTHRPVERCSGRLGCRVDPELARAFNLHAGHWWSQLHRAAKVRADRSTGTKGKLLARIWEKQKRGLAHVHGARRREIEEAYDKLQAAHKSARRFAAIAPLAELPVPGELAREYGAELGRKFSILELADGAAEESLRREAHRERPARSGAGARDVAIWLTAKEAHKTTGGPTHFVSANSKDFGGAAGALHPDLVREIERLGGEFTYCRSVGELLEKIATPDEPFIDVGFLTDEEVALSAAVAGIQLPEATAALAIPEELAVRNAGPLYVAGPVLATPTAVSEARGFTVEGRRISLGWTHWDFVIPVGVTVKGDAGTAQLTASVICGAALQMIGRLDADGTGIDAETIAVRGIKQS